MLQNKIKQIKIPWGFAAPEPKLLNSGGKVAHNHNFFPIRVICKKNVRNTGVASGWHGWTISRGPRAKGGLEIQRENEEKKRKRVGRGPGESVVHGPERPRYATGEKIEQI